jgi:hypothetical protein
MTVDLMRAITGERETDFCKEKQQMKTYGTIHLLITGRLLALAMLSAHSGGGRDVDGLACPRG